MWCVDGALAFVVAFVWLSVFISVRPIAINSLRQEWPRRGGRRLTIGHSSSFEIGV